jgi:tRNA G18 (ribose-2'-O)-methylase SpoU
VPVIPIDRLDDPRIDAYQDIKDRDLERRRGLFVVEGRGTLRCLIERSSLRPRSVLLGDPALAALADVLARIDPEVPIYLAPRQVLEAISGVAIHRGALALVERPPARELERFIAALPEGDSRVIVLEALTNHDNVGGMFRNAMAFGVDGALLCPRCCDPLYRKAIRTSMGGSLCIPFARATCWPDDLDRLRARGYTIVALDPAGEIALGDASIDLPRRVALVVGTEGPGITAETRARADLRIRIEMQPGVDSINVSTAAAIALHRAFAGSSDGRDAPKNPR